MSLSGSTVLEVRIGGSDTNGGGFVAGSIGFDYSQQNSPAIAVTDGVTAGTTTITSATASFVSGAGGHTGNLIYVSGGTGSVAGAPYQIVSVTNGTTIVVDRSTGLTAGTGVTLNVGGALATPGATGPIIAQGFAGIGGYLKYSATPYTMTTATAGPGGPVSLPSGAVCWLEGYDVTRGDRTSNRPIISWGTLSPGSVTYACVAVGSARQVFLNLKVDGNTQANAAGFNTSVVRANAIDCVAANCNGTGAVIGFLGGSNATIVRCQASACTTGFSACNAVGCDAVSCGTGFGGSFSVLAKCLARSCTSSGFAPISTTAVLFACTADSCTTAGFVNTAQTTYAGCIASNQSGGGGIGFSIGSNLATLLNCASYNNTTEISGTALVKEGMTLNAAFAGGQPYVSAGSDFRPNATAGAGALLRNAGIGCFGQADNADIGAVQHSDPAGGGGSLPPAVIRSNSYSYIG